MWRVPCQPRADLDARARELGFEFATIDGEVYWDERAYYSFTLEEIETEFEDPTQDLAALCFDLVARVIEDDDLLGRLAIPSHASELIRASWKRHDPALYGRFDFSYAGQGRAKLLEYNADTPTALYEAAAFQWHWLEDQIAAGAIDARADQFNSIHEVLIRTLRAIKEHYRTVSTLRLAYADGSTEDRGFIDYLEDCAVQAGFRTQVIAMNEIGSTGRGAFLDMADQPIHLMFKLYPWEWMFDEPFGRSPSMSVTRFIEPPWKAAVGDGSEPSEFARSLFRR